MNKNLVLIIENDNETRFHIEDMLRTENFPVLSAGSTLQGLKILETFPVLPNLIIIATELPGMNGFEFRKAQLANKKFEQIPVIFISQYAHHEVIAHSLKAEFVLKPVKLNILLQSIMALES